MRPNEGTTMASEDDVRRALAKLADPVSGADIVTAGRVSGIVARGGRAGIVLAVDGIATHEAKVLEARVRQALESLDGVGEARVILTAERGGLPPPTAADPHPTSPALLPEISAIVAVASGKGGVGKSTIAANLAVALAARGLRAGLLDADIYGPSVPTMLGRHDRAQLAANRIQPTEAHGIKAVSMGTMADPGKAVVWRGPMASSAMMQMLTQTDWGPLDVLVIDLPPGTGDIQLTMAQKVPRAGAVIVSTPQDLALIDARKAIAMFEKVGVPVLGMIENMSTFHCPACGHATPVFGHGGARETSAALGVRFLGEVPLMMAIREAGDAGIPAALGDAAAGQALRAIAGQLLAVLEER
jgi:ATP-binding protein involved in chromosome partitioning